VKIATPSAIVPQIAAPPPLENDAPAELKAQAGADSRYYSSGEANDKTAASRAQAWQCSVPSSLIVAVFLHRAHRPRDPLPAHLQRHIAAHWMAQ
jgi:hypothetical protein